MSMERVIGYPTTLSAARLFGGVLTWTDFAELIREYLPAELSVDRARWINLAELDPAQLTTLEAVGADGRLTQEVVIWPQGVACLGDGIDWFARVVVKDLTRFDQQALRGVLLLGAGTYDAGSAAALHALGSVLEMTVFGLQAAGSALELSALRAREGHTSSELDQARRQEVMRAIHDRTLADLSRIRVDCEQEGKVRDQHARIVEITQEFDEIIAQEGGPGLKLVDRLRRWLDRRPAKDYSRIELIVHDPGQRLDSLETVLADDAYHIAIAAAGNALMHSGADRIRIYLIVSGFLLVQVSDHGCGIADWPDPAVRGRRLGFPGMLARARRQNGRVLVETLEGQGTEIVAQLELDFNPLFTQEVGEQA